MMTAENALRYGATDPIAYARYLHKVARTGSKAPIRPVKKSITKKKKKKGGK